jgi:hypothetical protein
MGVANSGVSGRDAAISKKSKNTGSYTSSITTGLLCHRSSNQRLRMQLKRLVRPNPHKPTDTRMKSIQKSPVNHHQKHGLRFASKLMAAMAVGALGTMTFSAAHAQVTNSSIIGKAPTDATIMVHNSDTGIGRHGEANGKGRYNISSLPPGTYVVSLEKDGKTLANLPGISLFASKAVEVDFSCDNDQCTASLGH